MEAVLSVLHRCMTHMEEEGLHFPDIYEEPCDPDDVDRLHSAISVNLNTPLSDVPGYTIHAVCAVVKMSLYQLASSEPVDVTSSHQAMFDCLETFTLGLADIPMGSSGSVEMTPEMAEINCMVFKRLLLHLSRVAENAGQNAMDAARLAVIFDPILRHFFRRTSDDGETVSANSLEAWIVNQLEIVAKAVREEKKRKANEECARQKVRDLSKRNIDEVLSVLHQCMSHIEQEGLDTPCIYEEPCEPDDVDRLLASLAFLSNSPLSEVLGYTIHAVCAVVKMSLYELASNEPVDVAPSHQAMFDCLETFTLGLADIPMGSSGSAEMTPEMAEIHCMVFKRLLLHLSRVAENAGQNAMDAARLAVIFDPILRHFFRRTSDDGETVSANSLEVWIVNQLEIVAEAISEEKKRKAEEECARQKVRDLSKKNIDEVLSVLHRCMIHIEQEGLNTPCIYEEPCEPDDVDRLLAALGFLPDSPLSEVPGYTVHAVCAVVKMSLYELSSNEPVEVTPSHQAMFCCPSASTLVQTALEIAEIHRVVLRRLLLHLSRVAASADQNEMDAARLATVFDPIVRHFLRRSFGEDDNGPTRCPNSLKALIVNQLEMVAVAVTEEKNEDKAEEKKRSKRNGEKAHVKKRCRHRSSPSRHNRKSHLVSPSAVKLNTDYIVWSASAWMKAFKSLLKSAKHTRAKWMFGLTAKIVQPDSSSEDTLAGSDWTDLESEDEPDGEKEEPLPELEVTAAPLTLPNKNRTRPFSRRPSSRSHRQATAQSADEERKKTIEELAALPDEDESTPPEAAGSKQKYKSAYMMLPGMGQGIGFPMGQGIGPGLLKKSPTTPH